MGFGFVVEIFGERFRGLEDKKLNEKNDIVHTDGKERVEEDPFSCFIFLSSEDEDA